MTIVISTAGDDQFVAEHETDADNNQQNNNNSSPSSNNCFGDMFEEDWSPDWNLCGTSNDNNNGCWEASFPNDVCNNKEASSSDIADVDAEVARKLEEWNNPEKMPAAADDNTANVGKDNTTPPTDVVWLNDNMAAGAGKDSTATTTPSSPPIVSGMEQLQIKTTTKSPGGDDATVITTAETVAIHLTTAGKYAYKGACGAYKEGNDCLSSLGQTFNRSTCHQSFITSTMGGCNMLDTMCNDMSRINEMVTCQIFPCGDEEDQCNSPCGNKVDTSTTTNDVAAVEEPTTKDVAAVEQPTKDVPVEPTENVAGETF